MNHVKVVGVRVGEALYEKIEAYAKTRGLSISEAVRRVLEEYFGGEKTLDEFIAARVIANDEIFFRIVKAKLEINPNLKTPLEAILREFRG